MWPAFHLFQVDRRHVTVFLGLYVPKLARRVLATRFFLDLAKASHFLPVNDDDAIGLKTAGELAGGPARTSLDAIGRYSPIAEGLGDSISAVAGQPEVTGWIPVSAGVTMHQEAC